MRRPGMQRLPHPTPVRPRGLPAQDPASPSLRDEAGRGRGWGWRPIAPPLQGLEAGAQLSCAAPSFLSFQRPDASSFFFF